jgi:UDP-N-acetylmuramyl tripeptide synthase
LLVLGKGDEDYIEVNSKKIPFKDKNIILKYLSLKKTSL